MTNFVFVPLILSLIGFTMSFAGQPTPPIEGPSYPICDYYFASDHSFDDDMAIWWPLYLKNRHVINPDRGTILIDTFILSEYYGHMISEPGAFDYWGYLLFKHYKLDRLWPLYLIWFVIGYWSLVDYFLIHNSRIAWILRGAFYSTVFYWMVIAPFLWDYLRS